MTRPEIKLNKVNTKFSIGHTTALTEVGRLQQRALGGLARLDATLRGVGLRVANSHRPEVMGSARRRHHHTTTTQLSKRGPGSGRNKERHRDQSEAAKGASLQVTVHSGRRPVVQHCASARHAPRWRRATARRLASLTPKES